MVGTPGGRALAIAGWRPEVTVSTYRGARWARPDRTKPTKQKAAAAVRAAGTSLTGLFGVGPIIAAAVIGDVRHVSRFPNRDHFAAYNGTAPIEVSSGGRCRTCSPPACGARPAASLASRGRLRPSACAV